VKALASKIAVISTVAPALIAGGVSASGSHHARPQTIRVQSGETLWAIATRYYRGDPRQTVWQLEQTNRLRSPLLSPGQQLRLP